MDSTSIFIQYHPLTDWIQALGAVIAIVAGVWGFITLFRKDEDKEKQIKSLTQLAEENKRQSDIMEKQLENISKQTNIMFDVYKQNLSQRLNDIRPKFEYERIFGSRVNEEYHYVLYFKNTGKGEAIYQESELIESNIKKIDLNVEQNFVINKGEQIFIIVETSITDHEKLHEAFFKLNIKYVDSDGYPYSQLVTYKNSEVTIEKPTIGVWSA